MWDLKVIQMELDDDSGASSDYSLLGRMYKSKSLPGPGMQLSFYFPLPTNYPFILEPFCIVYSFHSILSSL